MTKTNKEFHPRKRFGQHFLHDIGVLQRIEQAIAAQTTDHLVEIGPGQGALTEYLLPHVARYDAIEIDRDLIPQLQQRFDNYPQWHLHYHDALQFDFTTLTHQTNTLRLVGNLPYNISTPLLFKLFTFEHWIQDMHFMLQKEVVDRLCAPTGSHQYSRLSVMAQYYCTNIHLFDIGPNAFNPPPKVDSALIRMIPHQQSDLIATNIDTFSTVVKTAFNFRRKTIHNSLKKMVTTDLLIHLAINPSRRPQELTVADYVNISNALDQH